MGKKSRIACNTGVIHVIEIFTQSCHVLHLLLLLLLLLPVEEHYLNNRNSNKHENLHVYTFSSWRVHCLVIFSLTLLLLVLLIVISTNNCYTHNTSPYYDFVVNYVVIHVGLVSWIRDAILSRLVTTYHQAPGASCSILYILVLSLVIFMQSLYTLSNL